MIKTPRLDRICANALLTFFTTAAALQATGLLNTEDGWKAVLYSSIFTAAIVGLNDYLKQTDDKDGSISSTVTTKTTTQTDDQQQLLGIF
jgi:hypothetical protein